MLMSRLFRLKTLVAAGLPALFSIAFAVPVKADISASAGVASAYLWRGLDLGDGSPAVYGDLSYSVGGAYAGVWGSSGDSTMGQEYDLYAGYSGELRGVVYDVSAWNFNYSDAGLRDGVLDEDDGTFGEYTDLQLALGYGPLTLQYWKNVAGGGFDYYLVSGAVGPVTLKIGMRDYEATNRDLTHVDLVYAYNDRLAFTFSQVVDDQWESDAAGFDGYDDDLKFVVSYTLPVDM